jgi:hypothetical protein
MTDPAVSAAGWPRSAQAAPPARTAAAEVSAITVRAFAMFRHFAETRADPVGGRQ